MKLDPLWLLNFGNEKVNLFIGIKVDYSGSITLKVEDIIKALILKGDKTTNEGTVPSGFSDYTTQGNPLAEEDGFFYDIARN